MAITNVMLLLALFLITAVASEPRIVNVILDQKEAFLNPKTKLVCGITLTEKPFTGDIKWYLDGVPLNTSIDHWIVSTSKPKVTYEWPAKQPGNYTCSVTDKHGQQWNTTARVITIKGESEHIMIDVTNSEIHQSCAEGPQDTSVFITVNGGDIDDLDERLKIVDDSFTLKEPELMDAENDYMCQYVFTSDITTYGNRQTIPANRVAYVTLPLILYKPRKDLIPGYKAKYSVTLQPSQKDMIVQICGAYNSTVMPTCDNDSLTLDASVRHVNFTIYKGTELLVTGLFKDSSVTDKPMPPEQKDNVKLIVGVVCSVAIVIIVCLFVCYIRYRRRTQGNGNKKNEHELTKKPLDPKVDQAEMGGAKADDTSEEDKMVNEKDDPKS